MRFTAPSGLVVLAVATLAGGCTTVGSNDFACPGRPPGVRCMSATEVYDATHATDHVDPTADKALGDDPDRATSRKGSAKSASSENAIHHQPAPQPAASGPTAADAPQMIYANTMLPAVQKPVPIRTPARVMRVWVAPWENNAGVLNGGGYSFIEVESRRWIVGETDPSMQPVRHFSIQNAKVDTKESVGKDQSTLKAASAGSSERPQRPNSTLSTQGAPK